MESRERQQREYQLVQLLLGDRAIFREYCTTILNLEPAELRGQADRDLIQAVLNQEFPALHIRWCLPERGPHRLPL